MKKFITRSLLLLLPSISAYVLFLVYVLPYALEKRHGPNTETQIRTSFKNAVDKDYNLLILGNSRIYRGLNPDLFSLSAYNFAHDNDTYNQMYFKLKYIINRKKDVKYVIVGIDYFQFSYLSDTRNYVYGVLFGEEYLADYNVSNYKLDYYLNLHNTLKIEKLFGRTYAILRDNGQYINQGAAAAESLARSAKVLPIQMRYFMKILEAAKAMDLVVFLVMPPILEKERALYSTETINKFDSLFENQTSTRIFYLNYSASEGFKEDKFYDVTHLSESGADEFSIGINKDLNRLLRFEH